MSDLINIPVRNIMDLATIENLPDNLGKLNKVKIPVGNLPVGLVGEVLTVEQLKTIVAQGLPDWTPTAIDELLSRSDAELERLIEDFQTQANGFVAQGFYKGFATEALLLAAKPSVAEMRARADDTRKIWRWNRTSAEGVVPAVGTWTDTGLSELDQAKNFTQQELIDLLINLSANSDLVIDEDGNKYLFSVLSQKLQKIMFGVTNKAEFTLGDFQLSEIEGQWLLADKSGRTFLRYANDSLYFLNLKIDLNKANGVLHISDSSGKTLFRLSEKGTLYASKYVGLPEQSSLENDYLHTIARNGQWTVTDIILMLVYGQSLSRGSTAQPIISSAQPFQNVMLKSGVLTRSNENGYDKSGFIPLVENWTETPASGICNTFAKRFQDSTGRTSPVLASASTGDGGRTIEELSKGGLGFFENTVEEIRDMFTLAQSQNKTFSVLNYNWFHGESNQLADDNSPVSSRVHEYISKLVKLKRDLDSEVLSITDQKFLPSMFMYQVASHRRLYQSKNMRVALAQLQMCNEYDDFIMSTPAYCLKHNTDHLHLTSEGSWLLGAYSSRAIYETIIMSKKWKPLQPSWVDWKPTEIIVGGWNSRGTTLVLDDALCALTENFGFDLFTPDAILIDIISNVTLTDHNTIKITLSSPAPNNAILCCGRGRDYMNSNDLGGELTGSRTNIRDNHGDFDEVTSPTGTTYKLHNASVMWQYSRKDGFNAV